MKRLTFAALLLLSTGPVAAQVPVAVPMQVTANDLAVFATAIRIAAASCGSANEVGCQIGLAEKAEIEKLNTASEAIKAIAAKADAEKKATPPK